MRLFPAPVCWLPAASTRFRSTLRPCSSLAAPSGDTWLGTHTCQREAGLAIRHCSWSQACCDVEVTQISPARPGPSAAMLPSPGALQLHVPPCVQPPQALAICGAASACKQLHVSWQASRRCQFHTILSHNTLTQQVSNCVTCHDLPSSTNCSLPEPSCCTQPCTSLAWVSASVSYLRALRQSTTMALAKRHRACARVGHCRCGASGLRSCWGKAVFRLVAGHCSVRQMASTSLLGAGLQQLCLRRQPADRGS